MKNDCDIVKDLLPTYVENICSPPTNEYIKTHLKNCSDCNELYLAMNDPLSVPTETISEKKVFSKIKSKNKKKLITYILATLLLSLTFGTSLVSSFTKLRFNIYIKTNYPEYDLALANFNYMELDGHGSSYRAEVYSKNEELNPDLNFSIYTEGLFLKIKDNYDYQIEKSKGPTQKRLINDYTNELEYVLHKNSSINFMHISAGFITESPSSLTLNMPYVKSIDQISPTSLLLSYSSKNFSLEKFIKDITSTISLIESNCFNPKYYTFDIYINQNDSVRIESSTQKLKDSKYLEEVIKKAFKESNVTLE